MWVGHHIGGDNSWPHRRKRIAGFASLPLTVCELKIARADIVEVRIAEHIIEGASGAHIFRPTPDDNGEFRFVINLRTGGRQNNWLTRGDYGGSEFREHDRSFRNRHITFSSVIPIVESDADQFPGPRDGSEPIRVFSSD